MPNEIPAGVLKTAVEKRILNEFGSKILNEERLEKVIGTRRSTRQSPHTNMSFHCECDEKKCLETIMMSTEEYQQAHSKTKHFIVVPSHVRLDLEEITSAFSNYVLVAKFFPHNKAS